MPDQFNLSCSGTALTGIGVLAGILTQNYTYTLPAMAGIAIIAWDIYSMMNIGELVPFFQSLKLQNHKGKTPKVIQKENTESGFEMIIKEPEGITLSEFEKNIESFREHFNCNDIDFKYIGNKRIRMQVITKRLKKMYKWERIVTDELLKIPIGKTRTDEVVYINLKNSESNILIAGIIGSGKSSVLRVIICYLILEKIAKHPGAINLHLCDLKGGTEFGFFKNSRYITSYTKDIAETMGILKKLIVEMERRNKLFSELGVVDIEAYNHKYGETKGILPYEVCIIDEFANLTCNGDKKLEKIAVGSMNYLGRMGRNVGIRLIIATQRPDASVVNGGIKTNFATRIAFKVFDRVNSEIILDHPGAELLEGNGHGILRTNSEQEFRAFWIDDKTELQKLIEPTNEYKRKEDPDIGGGIRI